MQLSHEKGVGPDQMAKREQLLCGPAVTSMFEEDTLPIAIAGTVFPSCRDPRCSTFWRVIGIVARTEWYDGCDLGDHDGMAQERCYGLCGTTCPAQDNSPVLSYDGVA